MMDFTASHDNGQIITNTIPRDISPEEHAELDKDVDFLSGPGVPFASRAPTILLTVINSCVKPYSQMGWPIDPLDKDTAQKLLESNEELRRLLQDAHRTGQYSQIRRRAEFHLPLPTTPDNQFKFPYNVQITPGSMDPTDFRTVKKSIEIFSAQLRPIIKTFLNNPRLRTWAPPTDACEEIQRFYRGLGIPEVPVPGNETKPSLLFHNLGNRSNTNEDKLFAKGKDHRILCNTSGAGKTALIFQGLCHRWGFYFVAARDDNGIGMEDLQSMIAAMPESTGWVQQIFTGPLGKRTLERNENERIATKRVYKVLVARWIVFRTFIEVARAENSGNLPESAMYDWLLLQALPLVKMDGDDPFMAAMNGCLLGTSLEVLRDIMSAFFTPAKVLGSEFNVDQELFFYVLDEAQVAGELHMGAFCDKDSIHPRPVLRPIIRAWAGAAHASVRFIVSGTGFSHRLFESVLISGVGKSSPVQWKTIRSTGDFINREAQESYISHYLPPMFLSSPSGRDLVSRMYEWLRGRHRFTATFLEQVLCGAWTANGPSSPHRLLDAYVRVFTHFSPLDGKKEFLNHEPRVNEPQVATFIWDKIEKVPHLLTELASSLFRYITRGVYPLWHADHKALVEHGIARFMGEGEEVIVEEPMALMSIMHYFETHDLTLEYDIRKRMQDEVGLAFEDAVLLSCTRLFRHGARLDEVFDFHPKPPEWASQTAHLVVLDRDNIPQAFDVASGAPVIPSAGITFFAKGPKDVLSWMTSKRTGWCCPGSFMGPDRMAWLRLADGRTILLIVQAKVRLKGTKDDHLAADVLVDAVRSVCPGEFFSKNAKAEEKVKVNKQDVEKILAAINQEDCFTGATYNILRVVATYPLQANFANERSKKLTDALNEDKHPIASMKHSSLLASLVMSDDTPSILSSLRAKRLREAEDPDEGAEFEQPSEKMRRLG